MAEDILELDHVIVTRFLGGTASRAGRRSPGTCYQITEGATYVELTPAEAVDVARAILRDAGARAGDGYRLVDELAAATRIRHCATHGTIDLDLPDDGGRLALDPRVPYGPRSTCPDCQAFRTAAAAAATATRERRSSRPVDTPNSVD